MSFADFDCPPVPGTEFTIRIFYPNPLPTHSGNEPLNAISKEYKVSYIINLDPVYHECVFVDDTGIRHRFLGLAYHVQEKAPQAEGIDAIV